MNAPTLERRCSTVDYDELERGLIAAREEFPTAHKITPHWTPADLTNTLYTVQLDKHGRAFAWRPA